VGFFDNAVKVKVRPTKPGDKTTDIVVRCEYCKLRKAVHLSAYPMESQPDGLAAVVITRGECEDIEPMIRLNRKRLEALQSLTRNEISLETGRAWALVERIAEKYGLEIARGE
jgi:hypothetical protein